MRSLKIALAAAVIAAASTSAFANGLTDKDAQIVNQQSAAQNDFMAPVQHQPLKQAQGSSATTER